jgi:hypothetical protein
VVTHDAYGNPTPQTLGPIYVDAPTTPDYINPDDGLGPIYRGWMDSGCSQIGADHELARNAASQAALADAAMYLTWDANYCASPDRRIGMSTVTFHLSRYSERRRDYGL